MRSLFFKIFLWFWLTLLVVGATIQSATYFVSRDELSWRERIVDFVPEEAERDAKIYESGGKDALEAHMRELLMKRRISAWFFFDGDGRPMLDRETPSYAQEVAQLARRARDKNLRIGFNPRRNLAARVVAGQRQSYIVELQVPRQSVPYFWMLFEASEALRFFAVAIVGGILCWLLARHITRPIELLRAATSGIAGGHLEMRAGAEVIARGDEIAQLGRDFDRMAVQIEALVAGQRRLLGDVSHELRSPLARLIVALNLVRQPGAKPEEASGYLDRIEIESGRLDKLIGQLLTLARIESTVDAGLRAPFDLAELMQEVAADGDFEARSRNRRIEVDGVEPLPMTGFAELMRSAIENVVRNAIRHTPEGTTVKIGLLEAGGGMARLSVRDHGPGVPAAMLAEIFQPFRRVGGVADGDGAGLGLAIADRVVRMHGGTIRAENSAGGGLTVEIALTSSLESDRPLAFASPAPRVRRPQDRRAER